MMFSALNTLKTLKLTATCNLLHVRNFKVDISLISKLRKETQCSISLAKSALVTSKNSYNDARAFLALQSTKKAGKVGARQTCEGLLGVKVGYNGATIVEVNCETDFVARSANFTELVSLISNSSFTTDSLLAVKALDVEALLETNLNASTIKNEITETIVKLGENIKLRRGILYESAPGRILGIHSHSAQALPSGLGRIASIVVLELGSASEHTEGAKSSSQTSTEEIAQRHAFAQKLAQHVSGFAPFEIQGEDGLLSQSFLFGGGTVLEVLQTMNLKVVEFCRWECGEGLEKIQQDFASEVAKQIKI